MHFEMNLIPIDENYKISTLDFYTNGVANVKFNKYIITSSNIFKTKMSIADYLNQIINNHHAALVISKNRYDRIIPHWTIYPNIEPLPYLLQQHYDMVYQMMSVGAQYIVFY